MRKLLAVYGGTAQAKALAQALGLGPEWVAVGGCAAVCGRQFDAVVLVPPVEEDPRWTRWVDTAVRTRLNGPDAPLLCLSPFGDLP